MPLLTVWPFNSMVFALRLTPIGRGVSAISKLVFVGSRALSTRAALCFLLSLCSTLTQNPVSLLRTLSPITMTEYGFPVFTLCSVVLDLLPLTQDVSGTQRLKYSCDAACPGTAAAIISPAPAARAMGASFNLSGVLFFSFASMIV